ncbi:MULTISPECIES: hypothetical protein [unclassified Microbacterium]|uniref:hypothetical protein n=1 Tax=unclassified Microbacterium TaxID=2609290 RepID=UPI001FCEF274|nr:MULTISPECIES: hypothetical protein [unclassified Microbacterium]
MIAPALHELGDDDRVGAALDLLRARGTGAERQRRALADEGTRGLARLLRAGTPAPDPTPRSDPLPEPHQEPVPAP